MDYLKGLQIDIVFEKKTTFFRIKKKFVNNGVVEKKTMDQ